MLNLLYWLNLFFIVKQTHTLKYILNFQNFQTMPTINHVYNIVLSKLRIVELLSQLENNFNTINRY